MEDPTFIKAAAEQGLAVMVVLLVLYWYRNDSKERIAAADQRATQERDDKVMIVDVVRENTRAVGELRVAIERQGERGR